MLVRSLLAAASSSFALFPAVFAQTQTPLPAISGAVPSGGCGGCYVVADVVDYVFGSQVLVTQTASVGVMTGRNGTRTTTVSVAVGQPVPFTYGTNGLVTGTAGPGGISYGNDTTVVLPNGITLTSPTQYQIFTAYSVTSTTQSGDQCVAAPGSVSTLPSPFVVTVTDNNPNGLIDAENAFIRAVGLPTCSAGGVNIESSTQSIIVFTTVSSTTTAPLPMTPQPINSPTTVTSTTTTTTTSSASTSTTTVASTATIVIISPNTTTPLVIVSSSPTTSLMPLFTGAGAALSAPSGWLVWSIGVIVMLAPTLLI